MAYKPRTSTRKTYRKRMSTRRKIYRKRRTTKVHGPKTFVSSYKLFDVISDPNATHPDAFNRNNLAINFDSIPLSRPLAQMYQQFAMIGVKYEYRATNVAPDATNPSVQMVFAEDKNFENAMTVGQTKSQDNCRNLVSNKNWNHYVKFPRPALFQQNAIGESVKAISTANSLIWLDTGRAVDTALKHLAAQLNIQNNPTANAIKQGELWAKVYVAVKEQTA